MDVRRIALARTPAVSGRVLRSRAMKNDALPLDVALQRVHKIAPMLRTDVETAIASHALMEATNEVVPRGLTDVESRVARSYAVDQQALALKVSMDLAQIFDRSAGYGLDRKRPPSPFWPRSFSAPMYRTRSCWKRRIGARGLST